MQSGDALEEGTWLVQSTQHSDEPQRCLLSQNPELGKRAGNGRPFGVFTVEVPGDVNTTGGAGDMWGVGMEFSVCVCVCVAALRASALDIPSTGIEFVGFGKQGCVLSSSHIGLP